LKEIDVLIADVLDPNAALEDRHRAFGEIVARFQDMAFACAFAILKDFYLAEDVAQEAFIAAWQKLDQLKDPKAFPGWFKRIVFTQCNRLTRARRLKVVPLETGLSAPSNSPDPQAIAEKIELVEKVVAAIRKLPDHERMVTTLFYIDGYSQNDISDFLEVPVTTVAKRLFLARQRLKKGLIGMLEENLKLHRPSRHEAFAHQVQARLRPVLEQDWETVSSIAFALEPDFRGDNDSWLRDRQKFDESRYIRRHYVGEQAETGQIVGYGSIEQTIFLPNYRLFLVVAPEYLRSGAGDLLLDRLMKDLREVNAIAVWHRNYAGLTDTLGFLKERGFVEKSVVWDLRLPVAEFDPTPFELIAEQVAARGVAITTFAEERERDPEHLSKLRELLNPVMADDPGQQLFAPVPLDTVARWFSRRGFLPDACFIAKDGDRYIGITYLGLIDEVTGSITLGFTGVLRERRRQGIATALKRRAVEYARGHGYRFMGTFNHHLNLPMLALNEKIGFRRRFSYVKLEKCLREVEAVDPAVYDDYVGLYRFDSEHLEKHGLPASLTVTIKKVGTRLISEIRDMQDELFPESETRFFIKMHYGEIEFVRTGRGCATRLLYRESEREMLAHRIA
jgi:RNA polymerase sigma factor (sigma-70 family)